MGVELLDIGVKVRKGVIFTIRGCFRTVCSHPFLVGMLCFLIFLYRSSPFIFHLLVSASPILVCTAVLLGTLLSFGQPNIPEIEIEEKTTVEAVSIKTGVLGDTTVVEKNESHYVERFNDNRWDGEEKSTEQLLGGKLGELLREEDSDDTAPLIEERSREAEVSDGEGRGRERELGELRFKGKSEWIEEKLNNEDVREDHHLYSSVAEVDGELIESDDEKSDAESFSSEKVNVDTLDSPPRSPWARAAEREDEKEEESEKEQDEDEESSDSESDCAESSSPDASMADIMPMLDELHPLLDEEGPQTVHLSRGSSDVASNKSLKSSHHHSEDESENHEDLEEAADDENEDEEDAHGDKDEETKSAITWTEQDQKNLMDLGSSELERNQRLENLILRRRARKSTNLFAEMNLIDLESSDLPFNIAPISTRRQNPFDLPQDNYDDLGLPPIPGSAPSVLLQRRNPFDIPYDSSEEKPDLMGDVFQEEFTSQSREPFFRRHESFNVGPSIFAPRKHDVKMRPYFTPERTISEESSSPLFQRQSSGLSDSKVSSVPETESVTSVDDLEEKKLPELDSLPEGEVVEQTKEVAQEGPSGDLELISRHAVDTEEDVHEEPDMISKMESVSEHIGHGSQTSEDDDYLELPQVENRDVQVEESQLEQSTDHYEQGSASQYVESRYNRDSSSSSLSEVSERVFIDTEGEGLSIEEGRRDNDDEEPSISTQTSLGSTDLNIPSSLVINMSQRAPVYDSSPRVLSKNVSSSSISADVLPESSLDFTPALDKLAASSIVRESEGSSGEIETDIPRSIEMVPDSSISHSVAAGSRVEEPLMEKHILDEVSVAVPDNSIDQDQAEEKHLLLTERHGLTEASETQFEGRPRIERSNSMDETVQSSDSDTDIQHETDEKLISMLSSEGNTSLFYDNSIQEPDYNYLNEVQETSTLDDSFMDGQITQDLNMPEVQEIDHYINSPSSPKFISVTPSAIETNSSRFDVQTVIEEADEIKEIDDGILSELDSVGDFSTRAFGSGASEFEKYVDSGGVSLFSVHHAETSSTVDEVEEMEHSLLSEESREHIDVYEHDAAHTSEIQTYQTSRAENTKVSEFDENDYDSPNQETSVEETLFDENEFLPSESFVNHNHDDMELQSVENVGVVATMAELASLENAEVSCQGQVDTDTTYGMPEVEASSIEDINLAFKKISSNEIENHTELHTQEETVSAIPEVLSIDDTDVVPRKAESTSVETEIVVGIDDTDTTSGMTTELEASTVKDIDQAFKQIVSEASEKPVDADPPSVMSELEATKIEDIDLVSKQISSMETEKHVVLEPPQTELHNYEDSDSGISEQEVLCEEDAHAAPKHTESTTVENAVFVTGADLFSQDRVHTAITSETTETEGSKVEEIDLANEKHVDLEPVDTDSTSEMPEIEATSVEAVDQAFKHISSQEIKDSDDLEPLQPELVCGETLTENSEYSSLPVLANETSVLEVKPDNDAIVDDKQMADIITGVDVLHDSIEIANNSEDAVLQRDRSVMVATNDSVDHTLHVVESGETQGASSSELHIAEAVPAECPTQPLDQVLDGVMGEQTKLKLDDEAVEVKADDKVGPSEDESSVKSAFVTEKPNHEDEAVKDLTEKPNNEDEAVKDLHSSRKGKGKLSRSSSSSSSSSSDSSSSDSDKE